MEYGSVAELAELDGYVVESSSSMLPLIRLRHPTRLGGLTVHLTLNNRFATVVIDGLGKRSVVSGHWHHYKLKRRNLNMSGLEVLLRNPFRGTFRDPLADGWVEHGSVVHRHTDHQQPPGGFALFHIFNIFNFDFVGGFGVHVVHNDEDVDDNGNVSDVESNGNVSDGENNDDVSDEESNDDVENNNLVENNV